jgi:putative flippase GtrA
MTIAIKYILFAILATGINIGAQYISLSIYSERYSIYLAMFWGTIAGLIVKYILDKKYIFQFQTKTIKEDSSKFFLYSIMGVLTTLIFWGFELTFNFLLSFDSGKYVGAVIGLSIGYLTKYQLDKKYVFVREDRNKWLL